MRLYVYQDVYDYVWNVKDGCCIWNSVFMLLQETVYPWFIVFLQYGMFLSD